ncbi:MAG: cellulose biosynthesis cyclic di-GMP-binding regulatory protein BcsB [Vampirovibrionales bacterium]
MAGLTHSLPSSLRRLAAGFLACWIALSVATPAALAAPAPEPTAAPVGSGATATASGTSLKLSLKDLGNPEGYTLQTVRSFRNYSFTKPSNWQVAGSSYVKVTFQHSPALLPERSSLNISINNRILKTIRLDGSNTTATSVSVPVPAAILKDYNTLSFDVNQHYTYKCEDPFSAELWSTLLPETQLVLNYSLKASEPEMARFPFPFLDPLAYGTQHVGYVLPQAPSSESLTAASLTAVTLAQAAAWRPFQADMATLSTNANLVVVGTPAENPAINSLSLPVKYSGSTFSDPKGGVVAADDGVLQVVRHPSHPDKVVLVVTGATPKAVHKAARMLARLPHRKLLAGQYVVVNQLPKEDPSQYHEWPGFISAPGSTSLQDLGFDTLTSRGFTALPIIYKLKRMPDVMVPGKETIKLKTVYSYSSQLSPEQAKLEVKLNGKSLKSVPLANVNGENLATLITEIPASDLFTYNDLEYQFYLFPDKTDLCKFVTDVHVWGTIHNSSVVEVPGQLKAAIPDVGLLNDAGFPLTLHPDMRDVTLAVPQSPSASELATVLALSNRLGRSSQSLHGLDIHATVGPVTDDAKKGHVVLIGTGQRHAIMGELDSKTARLVKQGVLTPGSDEKANETLALIHYAPEQGIVEQLVSPWNKEKVVVLLYGASDTALNLVQNWLNDDKAFSALQPGNVAVINSDLSSQAGILVKKGDARFLEPGEAKLVKTTDFPLWGWILLVIFAFIGLISFLKFLFIR